MSEQIIHLHRAVPPKPTFGSPCNGCGACCAAEPCPLSYGLLGHRHGSCPALTWQEDTQRYVCGLVAAPSTHLRWLPAALDHLAARAARRWIAAGSGCDFDAELGEPSA
jgi:hypothetical protein